MYYLTETLGHQLVSWMRSFPIEVFLVFHFHESTGKINVLTKHTHTLTNIHGSVPMEVSRVFQWKSSECSTLTKSTLSS